MKRKIIQDFANVCCQMFLASLTNSDRINFVIFGSGVVSMDFLTQRCTHNNIAVSPLFYCISYRDWLNEQCAKHELDIARLTAAELRVEMKVRTFRKVTGGIRGWLSTSMDFSCLSRITTKEREYTCEMADSQEMGLGQVLHGNQY